MSETLASLSDNQLVGFLLMIQFLKEADSKVGPETLKGAFLWARHNSDPEFKNEREDLPVGTGKFEKTGKWYMAFVPSHGIPGYASQFIGDKLMLSVFVNGEEKTALLTMADVLKIAKAIPDGSITMDLVAINSKGSSGLSS